MQKTLSCKLLLCKWFSLTSPKIRQKPIHGKYRWLPCLALPFRNPLCCGGRSGVFRTPVLLAFSAQKCFGPYRQILIFICYAQAFFRYILRWNNAAKAKRDNIARTRKCGAFLCKNGFRSPICVWVESKIGISNPSSQALWYACDDFFAKNRGFQTLIQASVRKDMKRCMSTRRVLWLKTEKYRSCGNTVLFAGSNFYNKIMQHICLSDRYIRWKVPEDVLFRLACYILPVWNVLYDREDRSFRRKSQKND